MNAIHTRGGQANPSAHIAVRANRLPRYAAAPIVASMNVEAAPVRQAAPLSKSALVEALRSGCKPRSSFRIGTEHEKLGFRLSVRVWAVGVVSLSSICSRAVG